MWQCTEARLQKLCHWPSSGLDYRFDLVHTVHSSCRLLTWLLVSNQLMSILLKPHDEDPHYIVIFKSKRLTQVGTTPGIRISTEKLWEVVKICCGLVLDTQSPGSDNMFFWDLKRTRKQGGLWQSYCIATLFQMQLGTLKFG